MELLILVIGLVVLDLLAMRFGYDSRDGVGHAEHGMPAPGTRWSDLAHEYELAKEIREARQRRLNHSQTVESELQPADADQARAA